MSLSGGECTSEVLRMYEMRLMQGFTGAVCNNQLTAQGLPTYARNRLTNHRMQKSPVLILGAGNCQQRVTSPID